MPRSPVMGEKRHPWRRAAKGALSALCGLVLLYLLAALLGSLAPRNPGWEEPANGIPVYLASNGVHVDLVLPARAAGLDLYSLVPPRHASDPAIARGWVSFGWGQREFYLQTEEWSDLSAGVALRAIVGGDALMHVEHRGRPRAGEAGVRALRLEPPAYRRLVAHVAGSFARGPGGAPVPVARGYGRDDVFYEARGRYSALDTSNQWTSDALARAGATAGLWTPFAQGVLWRYREPDRTDRGAAR